MQEPFVTLLIPCLNEARFIGGVLENMLQQTYPQDRMEVFAIDGGSSDETVSIIQSYQAKHSSIQVLNNPDRYVPQGMNQGIRKAKGDLIIRLDAHAAYPNDYVRKLVNWMGQSNADNVGGTLVISPRNNGLKATAITKVLAHPLGVGNAAYRLGVNQVREVDTVPFGCFRREGFQRYGLFDERLHRNQDIELNKRIRRRGGKVLLVPDVECTYFARETYRALWGNNFANGKWVLLTARITRTFDALSLRHFVPLIFVVYWLSVFGMLLIISLEGIASLTSMLWIFPGIVYLFLVMWSSIRIGIDNRRTGLIPYVFMSFLVLHFSYGWGSIAGLFAREPK